MGEGKGKTEKGKTQGTIPKVREWSVPESWESGENEGIRIWTAGGASEDGAASDAIAKAMAPYRS